MDAPTLQVLSDLMSKGSNVSMFVIVYFAWMSYRSLMRMEVMLEIALRERDIKLPVVPFVPLIKRRKS
jgi:hypothetical protein